MRLISSPVSPYARKVRMVAMEKKVMDRISVEMIKPLLDMDVLAAANPLSKVPVLVMDSGEDLFDSLVICEYLDQLDGCPTLIPNTGEPRFRVLTPHALAQGVMDAAFNIVMEHRRPEEQRSAFWLDRWQSAVQRGLVAWDQVIDWHSDHIDLATIATACALGYLQFRLPDLAWPERTVAQQAWWDNIQNRTSFISTLPSA
jgi:glutathione S-transferase